MSDAVHGRQSATTHRHNHTPHVCVYSTHTTGDAVTANRPLVYLASNLPFTWPGRHFMRNTLEPVLRSNGFDVAVPGATTGWARTRGATPSPPPDSAAAAASQHLGEVYVSMLESCDAVLALLDGPDVESGVAAAVGYAAHRVPVVGWRSDVRRSGEPITQLVNVVVEQLIRRSGGVLTTDLDEALQFLRRRFNLP